MHIMKIRDKEVNFRKWKVKDGKKFKDAIKNKLGSKVIEEALVYDCIEDKSIVLSPNEYKYAMIQIRKESFKEDLHYKLICPDCTETHENLILLDDIFIPKFEKYGKIVSGKISFNVGEITNPPFYKEEISKFTDDGERDLFDFIMHVDKINGSESFTFDDLMGFINDLDIKDAIEIFEKWEKMKFTLNDTMEIKCPHCEKIGNYIFDYMPDFLPRDWK